jgi:hypothetical protein
VILKEKSMTMVMKIFLSLRRKGCQYINGRC